MSKLSIRRIDAEVSKARHEGRETRLWDDDPKGLGLRIKPSGTATFFIQYRSPVTFKKVRHTLEQYGKITLEQARKQAKSLLGDVAGGADPNKLRKEAKDIASEALTVSEFCDDYLKDAKVGLVTYRGKPKKASTLAIDKGRIKRHIKPTLGKKLVRDVTRADVERAMHDIRLGKTAVDEKTKARGRARVTGGAGTASRTVTLLGGIFSYAIKLGVRDDNPVSGVERPPDGKRNRTLSPDEYKALGGALDTLEAEGATKLPLHALRVLALTGCRKGEILNLKPSEIDDHASCLRLQDSKTGQQNRPAGSAALHALSKVPESEGDYVFNASRGDGPIDGKKAFRQVFKSAGLKDVSAHVLRHSFASVALELGYSELTIAGLLGHSLGSVTSRYTHHVDRALVSAADRVSAVITGRMNGEKVGEVKVINIRDVVA